MTMRVAGARPKWNKLTSEDADADATSQLHISESGRRDWRLRVRASPLRLHSAPIRSSKGLLGLFID